MATEESNGDRPPPCPGYQGDMDDSMSDASSSSAVPPSEDSAVYSADQSDMDPPRAIPGSTPSLIGETTGLETASDQQSIPTGHQSAVNLDKPLPQVPSEIKKKSSILWADRPPLTSKSTNRRLQSESKPSSNKRKTRTRNKLVKMSISRPLLRSSSSSGGNTPARLADNDISPVPGPQPGQGPSLSTTQGVEDLERRLGSLLAQRESDGQGGQQGGVHTTKSTSTLQRGKNMLGRMKGALQSRLLGSSGQSTPTTSKSDVRQAGKDSDMNSEQTIPPIKPTQSGPFNIKRKPVPAGTSSVAAEAVLAQPTSPEKKKERSGRPENTKTKRGSHISRLFDHNPDWFNTARQRGSMNRQKSRDTNDDTRSDDASGNRADISANSSVPGRLDLLSSSPRGFTTTRLRLESRLEPDGTRRMARVRSDTGASFLGSFDFEQSSAQRHDQLQVPHLPIKAASDNEGMGDRKRKNRGLDGNGSASDIARKKMRSMEDGKQGDKTVKGKMGKEGPSSTIRRWARLKRKSEE